MLNAAPASKRSFPLLVPPIDWIFLCDDSPASPMVFYVQLDFSGPLHPELLDEALRVAVARHPLLTAKITPAKGNRLCWVPLPCDPECIWLSAESRPPLQAEEYLDVRQRPGLRIWCRQLGETTRLTLQFHHAACDGTGAYRFIGDLLIAYGQQLPEVAGQCQFGEVDVSALRTRRQKMLGQVEPRLDRQIAWAGLKEIWRMLNSRVAPLRCPDRPTAAATLPGMLVHRFDAEQQRALRALAMHSGVTVNDLLLWQMFRTIGMWNGELPRGRRVRVLVPSDTRDGNDFSMPAANMTAYTFVTAGHDDWKSPSLLSAIQQQTLQIKNGLLQRDYARAITGAMNHPQLTGWLLRRRRCLATAVLSNAGDPSRRFTGRLPRRRGKIGLGDLTLESITGVPPLRQLTNATVSVSAYGRGIAVSVRCDPHRFGEPGARRFLDLYCDQLRGLLPCQAVAAPAPSKVSA